MLWFSFFLFSDLSINEISYSACILLLIGFISPHDVCEIHSNCQYPQLVFTSVQWVYLFYCIRNGMIYSSISVYHTVRCFYVVSIYYSSSVSLLMDIWVFSSFWWSWITVFMNILELVSRCTCACISVVCMSQNGIVGS